MYAVNWPIITQGKAWIISNPDSNSILASEHYDDDFPKGSQNWNEISLQTAEIIDTFHCKVEEDLDCIFTWAPTVAPTRPTDAPTVDPTYEPTVDPTILPT